MTKQRKLIFIGCLLVAALAAGYLAFYYAGQQRQNDAYSALQQQATASPTPQPQQSAEPQRTPQPQTTIDFAAVQQENPDIYAWIEIPGTDVNYPILQHPTDDSYYLDHNLDGSSGYPGCIYTELYNAQDFSDFNTILYGHNMKNGSMFGGLKQYRDAAYLQEHREVLVYTPTETRVYQVFAAVVYSDAYLPAAFAMDTAEGREAFLASLTQTRNLNSQVLDDVTVTADSRILTLSTCIGNQPNNRYLVEAVYVESR